VALLGALVFSLIQLACAHLPPEPAGPGDGGRAGAPPHRESAGSRDGGRSALQTSAYLPPPSAVPRSGRRPAGWTRAPPPEPASPRGEEGKEVAGSHPDSATGVGGAEMGVGGADIKDRFGDVDAALRELVTGSVAFNTPERMRLGERRAIMLIASPNMNAETLATELRRQIGGTEPIAAEVLQVSPLMEARLEGAPAFDVTPLTPTQQLVARSAPTEWRWEVTAKESGIRSLHLTINTIITIEGERFPRAIRVLDRKIYVEISVAQQVATFLHGNWQWLAGIVLFQQGLDPAATG
jgi:hypothetical protein